MPVTERRTLPHALTDGEALSRADRAATEERDLRHLEGDLIQALDRHKSEKKHLEKLIAEKGGELTASLSAVMKRREFRMTDCVWLLVRSVGYALLFRADGGAPRDPLEARRLTENERQLKIGDSEADELPATEALAHLARLGITPDPTEEAPEEEAPKRKGKR